MPQNAKIIQDLSLLYELALAIGSSLDITENSQQFFRTLVKRKNLAYASLWLRQPASASYQLTYAYPAFRASQRSVPENHPMAEKMRAHEFFCIDATDEHFGQYVQEKQIGGGIYLLYQLGSIGFVKLYSNTRPTGFTEVEISQLLEVMNKFRLSTEACLASSSLKREAVQRLEAQKNIERFNAKIQESELKLRQILDSSLDGVITIDSAGLVTEWGHQSEKIFGYTRQEVIGKPLSDLIVPPQHRAAHAQGMKHFLTTGEGPVLNKLLELPALHKNGHEFLIELSITAIKNESGYFFSSFIRDITQRKNIEASLRRSEEKYRGIIENMELGLLEVDTEGKVIRAYDRFCQMTGYTNDELVGQQAEEVLLPPNYQPILKQQNEDRKLGMANVYEVEMVCRDGSLIWVLISGAPIYDGEGNVTGSLGIHYDITPRKRLEQELREAQQIAEKARIAEQQFLANMSHEIRTPMNTVIGMTHLLYETNPTPEQKDYLQSLRFSADNLMGIIDNILDMSKIEAGKLEFESRPFNLQELLKSLQKTFQFRVREKSISVVVTCDPRINNLLLGDATRLSQILSNLLSNAGKFTQEGTIGVMANWMKTTPEQYWIEFVVHDTGIGVRYEQQAVIFENFKQADVKISRKYGGTGLGLTIVKQLVELQGGNIRVESELGQGSRFIFQMPFGNSGLPATERELDKEVGNIQRREILSRLKVLVVEDNPMNQKLVKRILSIWQCEFAVVDDGLQAVQITQEQLFDIILMDIHMPEMDGFTATRQIRTNPLNLNCHTPILALTAAALLTEKEAAFESGMNDFLTKPFSPTQLESVIFDMLGIHPHIAEMATPSAEAVVPTVNLQFLWEFSGGDPIFIRDMVETFLEQTPAALDRLAVLIDDADWGEAYKVVHKLKPNFMMLGMDEPHEIAALAESLIKQGNVDATDLRTKLERLILLSRAALRPLESELAAL